jgi:glucose-6-phosphate isomerase
VLHTCLRAPLNSTLHTAELNPILKDVHEVLERIKHFSAKVRSGELKGATGKALTNLIVIGIGGSYLSI